MEGQDRVRSPGVFRLYCDLGSIAQRLVWLGYFEKLAKQNPLIGRSANDAITQLSSGERIVAAGSDATTLKAKDRGNPVDITYPEDGAVFMTAPSAILTKAPHPHAAELFMDFFMSVEYSELLARNGFAPMRPGVEPPKGMRPLSEVKLIRPPAAELKTEIQRSSRNSATHSASDGVAAMVSVAVELEPSSGVATRPWRSSIAMLWIAVVAALFCAGRLSDALAGAQSARDAGRRRSDVRKFCDRVHNAALPLGNGNSLVLASAVALLDLLIEVPMAWAVVRTDMPAKGLVRACVVGAFITPGSSVPSPGACWRGRMPAGSTSSSWP